MLTLLNGINMHGSLRASECLKLGIGLVAVLLHHADVVLEVGIVVGLEEVLVYHVAGVQGPGAVLHVREE